MDQKTQKIDIGYCVKTRLAGFRFLFHAYPDTLAQNRIKIARQSHLCGACDGVGDFHISQSL
jgi:hypothetical protein